MNFHGQVNLVKKNVKKMIKCLLIFLFKTINVFGWIQLLKMIILNFLVWFLIIS